MGKYRWLCQALSMCNIIILIVNFSQDYYVIIDRGVGAPGHGRYVVYGFNTTGIFFSFS